ncbi:MAG TPA: biotin--[acetyl-CoA-carboxylase] ligase [Pyrinomonadaceae bacterium]|jgi:BirA family biotin operon repressor/biotin-[acetyl-CoA-carboxylase] ligase
MNFTILRFDEIGSTNTEALNQAKLGADEGLCIVARRQTAGRGRHGRVWISEADAGLYFSIVLRPKLETQILPLITLMTAVAVHDTLEEIFNLECDIKWANDIHVGDKKICGILAETADATKGLAVVVGIGINIKSSNFPPEIADIATSIEAETGRKINSGELLEALTRFFNYHYEILQEANGAQAIRRAWTRRSSYAVGKKVRVLMENETISGTTDGIEENGALRVRTGAGDVRIIQAGDVEKLRKEE